MTQASTRIMIDGDIYECLIRTWTNNNGRRFKARLRKKWFFGKLTVLYSTNVWHEDSLTKAISALESMIEEKSSPTTEDDLDEALNDMVDRMTDEFDDVEEES